MICTRDKTQKTSVSWGGSVQVLRVGSVSSGPAQPYLKVITSKCECGYNYWPISLWIGLKVWFIRVWTLM
jgi:hypothetical protein